MTPSQMGLSPKAIRIGPTIGTTTKMISRKSRKNPMTKISAMTMSMAPNTPPGMVLSTSETIFSPPRPRNVKLNTEAPSRITKTMVEILTVARMTSVRTPLWYTRFRLTPMPATSTATATMARSAAIRSPVGTISRCRRRSNRLTSATSTSRLTPAP